MESEVNTNISVATVTDSTIEAAGTTRLTSSAGSDNLVTSTEEATKTLLPVAASGQRSAATSAAVPWTHTQTRTGRGFLVRSLYMFCVRLPVSVGGHDLIVCRIIVC